MMKPKSKAVALLAVGVGLLAIAAGCQEKQYAAGGDTPAAPKAAASPAATPDDGRAKPGSDDPKGK